MRGAIVLGLFTLGVAAAGEWEEPEAHERREALEEEREARQHMRMEAFGRSLRKEISVAFDDESLGDAIKFISETSGVGIALHKDVELDEEISLKLDGFPVHAVLEVLARICDLRLEFEGGVVVLMPKDEERNEIGTLWLEAGPLEIELLIYEDDVPPDLRHDIVRRALRGMHARRERERELHHPEREEEEHRRREREGDDFERPRRDEEF